MAYLHTKTMLAILGICLALRLVYQTLQRRFFHPLRSIPGPFTNSISELPAALALVSGNQHVYYRSLHEKYGPVVRVSPNEVSFVSVEAREEIYGHRKAGLMEKSPIFLGAVGSVEGQTGVSLALHKDHARQRRALGYLFTNSALLNLESLTQAQIRKFIDRMKAMAAEDRRVDVADWYTYLAFDIMGTLCFGSPFGCLDNASSTEWSTSVINVFVSATYTQAIRRLTGVGTYLEALFIRLLVPAKAAAWRKTHLNNSRDKTLRRLADPQRDHTDFIYQILKRDEAKGALTETEIVLNMGLFISAGTDTTATALTGWTYYICTHPQAYTRLVAEIRSAFANEDEITWAKVKELRFLEATLNEALRLFAPSPASQQRIVPHGGAVVDGYVLPAGTTVAVSPWSSTHSHLNFHDPDGFHPERWLQDECSKEFANDRLDASVPFGNGPRVCIGRNLAYMEMRLIAAHLLWEFDLSLDRGRYEGANEVWGFGRRMNVMKVYHSMTKPALWVRLEKRM